LPCAPRSRRSLVRTWSRSRSMTARSAFRWMAAGTHRPNCRTTSCLPLRGLTIPLYTTTSRVSRFPSQHLKVLAEIFKPGYWYNWYMAPRDITMARRDPGAPCGYLPTVPEILPATPAQAAGVLRWTPNVHLLSGVPLELVFELCPRQTTHCGAASARRPGF
jgi:hypothetical protein